LNLLSHSKRDKKGQGAVKSASCLLCGGFSSEKERSDYLFCGEATGQKSSKSTFLGRNFLEIFGDITLDVKKSVKVGRLRSILTSFERQN